ncbi:hypothetical protein, partial [Salmonella enterica]|uniref:hypothetical protein n=1 Tax=Salmonella enterica TaxID=28901 RepID=UPI0029CA3FF4
RSEAQNQTKSNLTRKARGDTPGHMKKSDAPADQDKEAKLAQALRANLRRRKAAAPPKVDSPPKRPDEGESSG